MAPSLLHPPSHLSSYEALDLSQRAPAILASNPRTASSTPILSLFTASETAELWLTYENLLLSCLRTGDEPAAHECLSRLEQRFGADNEKIMAMKGLVQEAEAQDNKALEEVLKGYSAILETNSTNIPITKRRIALLRSLGRMSEAVAALNALLEFLPVDTEAWAELADMYVSQGMYPQAIFALEEVLVLTPNAWNIHARLGELQYMLATLSSSDDSTSRKAYAESLKRFSRSIELCDDYLRGYYGLKLVTAAVLPNVAKYSRSTDGDDFVLPDRNVIETLSQLATSKLSDIVRRSTNKDARWRGYDEMEVAAARELLSGETAQLVR